MATTMTTVVLLVFLAKPNDVVEGELAVEKTPESTVMEWVASTVLRFKALCVDSCVPSKYKHNIKVPRQKLS